MEASITEYFKEENPMKLPKEVILSVMKWANLLEALKAIIEQYGIEETEQAIDHFKATGKF